MQYPDSIIDIITARTSCRTYIEKIPEKEKISPLQDFIENIKAGPFGNSARFMIVSSTEDNLQSLQGLGTYGFIKGARAFIIGAVKNSRKNLEDYGYQLEKIILYASGIGLGTCWLGGTFSKSGFAEKISAGSDDIVPAVSPLGHSTKKRRPLEKVIRYAAGSRNRKVWESLFFQESFQNPLQHDISGEYTIPLEMVRIAPSASNKQPWRIIKEKNENIFHFFRQRTKGYHKQENLLKMADLQRIDMGIAMSHFELTAEELNLKGLWKIMPPEIGKLPDLTEYLVSWVSQ